MNGLTRHQAAEMLGVSDQTVSNYCEAGLLGSCRGKGNILYVNAYDVEKYNDQLRMIHASEKLLDLKQRELRRLRKEADAELQDARKSLSFLRPRFSSEHVKRILESLVEAGVVSGLRKREIDILYMFVDGWKVPQIAEHYSVSRECARYLLKRAVDKLCDTNAISSSIGSMRKLEAENESLRTENELMRKQIASKGEKFVASDHLVTLLNTRLVDCNLSVRALNVLKGYTDKCGEWVCLETVKDLLVKSGGITQLMRQRNLGKKTLYEITSFVKDLGLNFKFDREGETDFYERLEKGLGERRSE